MCLDTHMKLALYKYAIIIIIIKSSGWSTQKFVMSSGWFRVESYVIRMRYYLTLSDPYDLLHCRF